MTLEYVSEPFTPGERALLEPHFTNLEGPVFALTNMPEVVKGALFARYSRSSKSLRRLFLDEFAQDVTEDGGLTSMGEQRAEQLYDRVFLEYGDDSVAQLGGVHLACEQASQLLCKALEWGRFAAYLEQSTRYMRYDDKPGGRWRATLPPEVVGTAAQPIFERFLDIAFGTYGSMYEPVESMLKAKFPKQEDDPDSVYRQTIMAKTCDTLRALLPAATRSNLGIYATGQSYEQLLMRLRVHPLAEMREYGALMLTELRKVIPAFLKRVDIEDRGVAWSRYWADVRDDVRETSARITGQTPAQARDEVTLTDWDADAEIKIAAAVMYPATGLPDDQLLAMARDMSSDDRAALLAASVGERGNRRHKPGRAWERSDYRFDVLCDFGAFRDLQRHRPLTVEWQTLTCDHGYGTPPEIEEAGLVDEWNRYMAVCAETEDALLDAGMGEAAQYAVAMSYKIRFVMQMNAREAMHLIELRSSPQGHPTYRRVALEMHRQIDEVAGHHGIAAAFTHLGKGNVDLERLEAERRLDAKRRESKAD